MKRIESSKEAFRNLTLIASDGASEYSSVNLNPSNWAKHVQDAWSSFSTRHPGRSPVEIRSEIKPLRKLFISHEAMYRAVEKDTYLPITDGDEKDDATKKLREAYVNTYKAVDRVNSKTMPESAKIPTSSLATGDPDKDKVDGTAAVNGVNTNAGVGSKDKNGPPNGSAPRAPAADAGKVTVDTSVVHDDATVDKPDTQSETTDTKFGELRQAQQD